MFAVIFRNFKGDWLNLKARKSTLHKRIFIAFSDLAILAALKNQAMTGYGINNYFMKKVGDTASPSMIYAALASMEREGWIKCIRDKGGRVYDLTNEGIKIGNDINNRVQEIKLFIDKLLT
jgi:DNA-binding PadR family transcriptional regulator